MNAQKIISITCSILGAGGVVATGYLAAKEAPKAKEAMSKLAENATFWQKVKCFAYNYKGAIAVGGLTVGTNLASQIMQQRVIAGLTGAVVSLKTVADNSEKFKSKAKDIIGKENYNKITKALANDQAKQIEVPKNVGPQEILVWEEHVGYFLATEANIRKAHGMLNRRLNKQEAEEAYSFNLDDFLNEADAELLDPLKADPYLKFGWGCDHLWSQKGDNFVDIDEELFAKAQKNSKGDIYHELRFEYAPVYDPDYFEDAMRDYEEAVQYIRCVPEDYQDEMRKELGYEPRYVEPQPKEITK